MGKITHLVYCPFTGLGNYNGFRGNTWLKNRIKIFKQFVLPSLLSQTNQDFTLWISWRREERNNPIVKEFILDLDYIQCFKVVHTFAGICFYDDKYNEIEARERLINALQGSMGELLDVIGECEYIYMTIQPSDDCYHKESFEVIRSFLKIKNLEAVGFKHGYISNYLTKEVAEYNPLTNPPFYTIKFPREVFIEPYQHLQYTSLKEEGKYKRGTPLPSHEYVGDCLNYNVSTLRGFLVGCHGVNISTNYDIPYKGVQVDKEILRDFGIYDVSPLEVKIGWGKKLFLKFPYKVRRKLRYWWSKVR